MVKAQSGSDGDPGTEFQRQVARKAERRLRAKKDQGVMFWLGMFGLVGWSVAIPTVAGIALGNWLDARWPVSFSWTLTLLFTGVILGCINAWYWIRQEHESE